jgi:hypothetical protein
MVTSLGVMRIFPIQIITEEGRVIKGLCSSRVCLRGDQNRHPESFLERRRGHAQTPDTLSVFSHISLDTLGRRWFLRNQGVANHDAHVTAVSICVEIQSDSRMVGNMAHFGCRRLAKDQDGLTVPMKPDRPGLRRVMRVYGREPDDLLLAEATLYLASDWGIEIGHELFSFV